MGRKEQYIFHNTSEGARNNFIVIILCRAFFSVFLFLISVFCFLISVLQSCACKVVGGVAIIKVGSINNRPISCRVHSADGRVLEG